MPDITLTAEQSVFIRSFPKKIYGKGETIIYQGDEIKNVFFNIIVRRFPLAFFIINSTVT